MSKMGGQTREGGRDKGEGGLEEGEGFPWIKGWRGFTGGKAGRD